jgi:hypothetical protein
MESNILVNRCSAFARFELKLRLRHNIPSRLNARIQSSYPVNSAWPRIHQTSLLLNHFFYRIIPYNEPIYIREPQPLFLVNVEIKLYLNNILPFLTSALSLGTYLSYNDIHSD